MGYCRDLTRHADDAADLCQETAIRAHRYIHRFDGSDFTNWCKRIALRLHINSLRKKRGRPVPLSDECSYEVDPLDDLYAESLYNEAMLLLDEDKRATMAMTISGVPDEEIALRLGITRATVKTRRSRARRLLVGVL